MSVKRFLGAVFTSALTMFGVARAEDAGSSGADGRIMMHYGWYSDRTYFDASQWFKNGMYKRKINTGMPSGYSEVVMIRVSPLPIEDSDLGIVRAWLATGLDPVTNDIPELGRVPEGWEEYLMDRNFDPRPQIIYTGSHFAEPDMPVDVYGCYLLIKGKRFFVNLKRDGRTGKFIGARRTDSVVGISYQEQKKLFKKLEEKQRKPAKPTSDAPQSLHQSGQSITVGAGSKCPMTGWWFTYALAGEPRYFNQGEVMPELEPGPTYWQWGGENKPQS